MASQKLEEEKEKQVPKAIPLSILIDKQAEKVVAIESNKDFIDALFSFLSLPLATIVSLLKQNDDENEDYNNSNHAEDEEQNDHKHEHEQEISEPILGCMTNLYHSAENLTEHDVLNFYCKRMLLSPTNPCEQLHNNLYLNVDDVKPTPKVLVCDSCNKFTTLPKLRCVCGKFAEKTPSDLDLEAQGKKSNNSSSKSGVDNEKCGVFVKDYGSVFHVFDDLTVVPRSFELTSKMLIKLGYSDLSQLDKVTQDIGKHEILNLLRNTVSSNEPLTTTFLASKPKKKDKSLHLSAIRGRPVNCESKMNVKLIRSKSQNRIVFAEANEDFVDFIFSFLTIPLGTIVKLFDGNSLVGSVDNLYKSVETLDSSWCTDSRSVLLNPGIAPQHGFPKQPLNIPDVEPPTYFYGTRRVRKVQDYYTTTVMNEDRGVISKSNVRSIANVRSLTALDPRSPNSSKENIVGFVKRPALYAVRDDLRVTPLTHNSYLFYLQELNHPLDDLEEKVISISEAEALSLLRASLTSKYTLNNGLKDFLDVPSQESNLTSKETPTSHLDDSYEVL